MFEEGSDPRFQMLIKSDNIGKKLTTIFTCVEGTGNLERRFCQNGGDKKSSAEVGLGRME